MTRAPLICVGMIAGSYGVRGEVRIKSFCGEPRDIEAYQPLWSKDQSQSFKLSISRQVSGGFAARFKGVHTREEAMGLKGTGLYAERSRLPELPADEFYHADLIGMEALGTGGEVLGKIAAVHDHGAGDLLEIRGGSLGKPVLLPFTRETVPTVDLNAGRIIADIPEGLIDGPDPESGKGEA